MTWYSKGMFVKNVKQSKMDAYNKKTINDFLNESLVIHWWNFRTKTLDFKGTVKEYLIVHKIKYKVKPVKQEFFETLKFTCEFDCGNLQVKFTSTNMEDMVRMVINIKLSYMGDKSCYELNNRRRTINF